MKYLSLFFILLYSNVLLSQKKLFSKLYFNYEISTQTHFNKIITQTPFVKNEALYPTSGLETHIAMLGYQFNEKWSIETGFYWKYYFSNVDFTFGKDYDTNGYGTSIDILNSVPIRAVYSPVQFKIFKRPFKLQVAAGMTIAKSEYYFGYPLGGAINDKNPSTNNDPNDFVLVKAFNRHHIDNGIRPYHFLIDGRLQMEYQVCKLFSIFGAIGYKKALQPIGYFRGTYKFSSNSTVYEINNVTYGNHNYRNLGIRINPFYKWYKKGKDD